MSRRRLRLTCESALRIAEWQLARQRRRALAVELVRQERAAPIRPELRRLYAVWIGIGLLLLSAILFGLLRPPARQVLVLPYLLASLLAFAGAWVHARTYEVAIRLGLRQDAFLATAIGPPSVTRALQRLVWHFHTVSWLATAALLGWFSWTKLEPPGYAPGVVRLLVYYWLAIVAASFLVAFLSAPPGDSVFDVLGPWFQWLLALVMVALMYWGTKS